MNLDPIMIIIFGIALAVVLIGLVLKLFNQPHVITYILAGVLLGPSLLNVVKDTSLMTSVGSIGLIFLMFFVGMEISLPRLVSNWKVAIIGPVLQVIIAFGSMLFFGKFLGWDLGKSVLMAFVITLSSTAVIVKILKDWKEMHTKIGQDVLGILIVQDILVVPMLLILNFFDADAADISGTIESVVAGIIIIGLIIFFIRKENLKFPFEDKIKKDPELFIFFALIVCFGFSILTSLFGLSSALGAFIAGILVSEGNHGISIKKTLEPFYFFFVAIFFISIGMILDINYVMHNYKIILALLVLVFILSTFMNTFILRFLGSSWKESFYGGALLSQLGEFGFIIAAIGLSNGIISQDGNALIISLIAITLILSPFWVKLVKTIIHFHEDMLNLPKNLTKENIDTIYSKNTEFMKDVYRDLKNRVRK